MNALRGAIVVIVALVIAVVILARGLDDPEAGNEPVETTDTTASTDPAPPAPPPPADDPAPPAPPPPADDPAPPPPPPTQQVELPDSAPEDMFSNPPPPPAPTHNRDQVRVLVANGTNLCGAAGRLATSLSAQGYNVLPAVNADIPAEVSSVFYVDEYGADAGVVASLLQVPSAQVLPLPASPPTAPGDAHVVIHIGADDLAQPNC